MKTNPKSENAIREEMLLPPGDYDFEVLDAVDKISKSGNEMIATKIAVFRPNGSRQYVNDYLMEKMAFRLRHFCYAVGLGDKYEAGDLAAEDCKGRAGRLSVKIEEQVGFPPKNVVNDYIVPDEAKAASTAAKVAKSVVPPTTGEADQVPF